MSEKEVTPGPDRINEEPETTAQNPGLDVDRRGFLGSLGFGAATLAGLGSAGLASSMTSCRDARAGGINQSFRASEAVSVRRAAANAAFGRGFMPQTPNSDESRLPDFIGNFSKGLAHLPNGQVDPAAYTAFRNALDTQNFGALDSLMVGPRKLENPAAGVAYTLEGADPVSLAMPAAPEFDSAEEAGEMVELYWMALLRDVNFRDYDTNPDVAAATADLNALSDFRGPRSGGMVTPGTLFRNPTPGDLAGPYISQFLLSPAPYGTLSIDQRQRTFVGGLDHMTTFSEWLAIQEGQQPSVSSSFDGSARYIRNLRDLAAYVQVDFVYQAYLNALLIMLAQGVPLKPSVNAYLGSPSQVGFATLGPGHFAPLLTTVAVHALRAVWYQKWFVHRRLRPEAFGGRLEAMRMNMATYPIHPDAMNSAAYSRVLSANGTALLPMAYTEGSPRHPAYGAGHNIVGAACCSILKAFFDESAPITNPMQASADGLSLEPYTGPDAGSLTVGGELDKLAGNVAQGRNAAGVHWRTDYTGSMPLGESVAEALLADQQYILPEDVTFQYTRLDGTQAIINPV